MLGPAPHFVVPHPGPRSKAVVERLRRMEGGPGLTFGMASDPPVLARAEGAVIEDPDGNRFLDMVAGFGSLNLGHSHPGIVSAVASQVERGQQAMSMASTVRTDLLEHLTSMAPGLDTALLTASGSEATETALKLVRRSTGKSRVLAFAGAFHGRTTGALSLMGRANQRAGLDSLGTAIHLPYPHALRSPFGDTPETVVDRTLALIDAQLADPTGGWDDVGAVVVEPVQGNGGMIPAPIGFLRGLREVCDDHELLLVCDEVMSGFHRTGRQLAFQHEEGSNPDLVIIGKSVSAGLPLSGVLTTRSVAAATAPGTETSTYSGNLVSCAAASAAQRIYAEMDASGLARRKGEFLVSRLASDLRDRPAVAEIRGRGLMVGVELCDAEGAPWAIAKHVSDACIREGLLVYPGGHHGNVIGWLPPLVATEEQLATASGILAAVLGAL